MLKTPFPHPSLLSRLNCILTSLSPLPNWHRKMGNGYTAHTFPLMLLPQGENSSPSSPNGPSCGTLSSMNFSTVNLSHGLQLPTKCCSVGPFHGMSFFRNKLIQPGIVTYLWGVANKAIVKWPLKVD